MNIPFKNTSLIIHHDRVWYDNDEIHNIIKIFSDNGKNENYIYYHESHQKEAKIRSLQPLVKKHKSQNSKENQKQKWYNNPIVEIQTTSSKRQNIIHTIILLVILKCSLF